MAAELLICLGKANLAAALAISLVLSIRKPLRKIVGARIAYALWLFVPLMTSASLLPARTVVVEFTGTGALSRAPFDAWPHLPAIILTLWGTGCALSLCLLASRQARFVAALGDLANDGRYWRTASMGIGPAVVGAIRPRIVLPADFEGRFDPQERDLVLAHEEAHLASGDAFINAAVAFSQCLCWFNPLVHLAAHRLRHDQELACDAMVLARRQGDHRVYAQALLKGQLHSSQLPLGCYWPAPHGNPLKERVSMLKSPTPSRSRMLFGAGAIASGSLCFAAVAWAAQPPRITVATPQRLPGDVLVKALPGSTSTTILRRPLTKNTVGEKKPSADRDVDFVAKGNIYPQPFAATPKPAALTLTSSIDLAEGAVRVEGDSVSFDRNEGRAVTFRSGSRTSDEVVVRRIVDGQPDGVVILRTGPDAAATIYPVNP